MEKIERLYRMAIKHKLNFFYKHSAAGNISVILYSDKSELMFDFTEIEPDSFWIMTNSERYNNFDEALKDYEDLLILHGE